MWFFCFFFFLVLAFELRPYTLPFSSDNFFRDKVSWTVYLGWLQTMILLISAPWVARITNMNHPCLVAIWLLWWTQPLSLSRVPSLPWKSPRTKPTAPVMICNPTLSLSNHVNSWLSDKKIY
jgi:hypothetical protein